MGVVLAILLLAQTSPVAPPPAQSGDLTIIDASPTDAAAYRKRAAGCGEIYPEGDDVVVCARMTDMPRSLAEQAAIFEPKPFRPAWKMLGGDGDVGLQQRSTPMGSAPAIMATFKLKF